VTLVALKAGDLAVIIVAAFFALVAFVLSVVLANLFRVVSGLNELVDGIRDETVPLIGELGNTVRGVNKEIDRVDGVMAGVQGIVGNIESITRTVQATVTNPLVKGLAFFMGAKRAARKMKDKD
jgi:uncharacterized protein YoxC